MEPQYLLLIQQIQANAAAIEQNLHCLYDPEVYFSQKWAALSYVRAQAQQIENLTSRLYEQFRFIERDILQ